MNKSTIATKVANFLEDIQANLQLAKDKESALIALRAIALDALLLDQMIRNEHE
jgi:DNA-binding response OmpR family regulator